MENVATLALDPALSEDFSCAVAQATALYERGLYLQARDLLEPWGSPKTWLGAARIFGSRLATNLGGARLGDYLATTAYRRAPKSAEANLYYGYHLLSTRGPWPAWDLLRNAEGLDGLTPSVHASILATRGHICGLFRDRLAVEQTFARAHELDPSSPWVWTEESCAWEKLDEPEKAMEAVRRAYELTPSYRPTIQQLVQLLINACRDEEAEAVLTSTTSRLESGYLYQQWLVALSEREDWVRMPGFCAEARRLLPWAEKPLLDWIAAREIDAYCGLKDFDQALALAERQPEGEKLCERIRGLSGHARKIKLNVPFIRQDDATCAPASLASVAAYWQWDVTHDEIAEAVCYGGTYPHGLREWVEKRGWIVREFQVTWDSTRQLIDRGVPFLLATSDVGSGHMQVVEGYDEGWGSLLIRDPNFRHHRAVEAAPFLQRYEAFGPRGFVIYSRAEAVRLDGLELPCQAGFDRLYQFSLALQNNARSVAATRVTEMTAAGDVPFLLFTARLALADYDANPLEKLRCLEDMEAAGFRHPLLQAMRLSLIRDFRPLADYLAALEAAADIRQNKELWDPTYLLTLAGELSSDEANFRRVRRLFRRYHAINWRDAGALSFWGQQLWTRQEREPALDLMRFSCTSADKVEQFASSYFWAAYLAGREHEAIETLQERVIRYGAKSYWPSRTLYSVFRALFRDDEAFAVLAEAVKARPADGDLILFTAYERAIAGAREEGARLLAEAEHKVRRSDWLRTAARLATLEGAADQEKLYWEEVARLEPFALDAQAEVARLITEQEGPVAGVAYWDEKKRDFPYHLGFAEQAAAASLQVGEKFALAHLRACIAMSPLSLSPRVELIRLLLNQGEHAEAVRESESLIAQSPHVSQAWFWRGRVYEEGGQLVEAKSAYRHAIRLDVDNRGAIYLLWSLAATSAEQEELLRFLESELQRQLFLEQGLYAWYDLVLGRLSWEDLQPKLEAIRSRRENSWVVWCCCLRNFLRGGRVKEALALSEEILKRFSLLPAAWLEVADAQERAQKLDDAANSLLQAIHLEPTSSVGVGKLAWLRERQGRPEDALTLLEQALGRNPLDAVLYGVYAGQLWKANRREDAYAAAQQALRLNSSLDWLWPQFQHWCVQDNQWILFRDFAVSLSAEHPGESHAALIAARAYRDALLFDKAEEIVKRVLEVRPRLVDAHLLRSDILVTLGLFDDAIRMCHDPIWENNPPTVLKGQAAYITSLTGKTEQAVEQMQKVVARDPSYAWGWEKLCEWQVALRRPAMALQAAQKAAELQPSRGYSWYQWAHLHRQLGNVGEMRRLLRETVAREPGFEVASLVLIESLLTSGHITEAEKALEVPGGALSDSYAIAGRVMIDTKRRKKPETLAALERLFITPGVSFDLIRDLRQLLESSSLEYFQAGLSKAISNPDVQPMVAAWWVEEKLSSQLWSLSSHLIALPEKNGARKEALSYYLRRLPDFNRGEDAAILLARHADLFRKDDMLWARLGLCLATHRPRDVWDWMKDWATRLTALPWMLRGASAAALAIGNFAEAFKISRAALLQETRDNSLAFHQLVGALEKACAGEVEEARALHWQVMVLKPENWDESFAEVVNVVIDSQRAGANVRQMWRSSFRRLRGENHMADPLIGYIVDALSLHLRRPRSLSLPPAPEGGRLWKRPSHRWTMFSYAVGAISLLIPIVFIASQSEAPDSKIREFLTAGCMLLGLLGSAVGAFAAGYSLWNRRKMDLAPGVALIGNIFIFLAFFIIALVALDGINQRPAMTMPLDQKYHHPEKAFSFDLRKLKDVQMFPIQKDLQHPQEGVLLAGKDESWAAITATPDWTTNNKITSPEEYVTEQLRGRPEDANVISASRFVDQTGRPWLRVVFQEAHPIDKKPAITCRDLSVSGSWIIHCQVTFSKYRFDQLKAEMHLAALHRRLSLQPDPEPAYVPTNLASADADLIEEARALKLRGQMEEALTKFTLALGRDPKSPTILAEIAEVNFRLNQFRKTIEFAEKAVDLNPQQPVWSFLIRSLLSEGRTNEAKYMVEKALTVAPDLGDVKFAQGLVYQAEGDRSKAIEAFSAAIETEPENRDLWYSLMLCYAQTGDWKGAEAKAKELLQGRRNSATGWYYLAVTQGQTGMPRISLASFQRALEMKPDYSDAWNGMGLAYLDLKEYPEARRCFKAAVESQNFNVEAWNNLGYTEALDGAYPAAVEAYLKGLEVDPQHVLSMVNLTDAYIALGDVPMARRVCDSLAIVDEKTAASVRERIPKSP